MSEQNELRRAVKSLETVRRAKDLLPSFFRKQEPNQSGGLAWAMVGISPEILYAFDIPVEWPENYSTLCASKLVSTQFIEQAEADGYSPDLCSYLLNNMGYVSRMMELGGTVPPEAPKGGMGSPTMLLSATVACDPRSKWFQSLSSRYMSDIPVFAFEAASPPYDTEVGDPNVQDNYKALLRDSLQNMVTFLSQQTGRQIDLARLRHAITVSHEQAKLIWEIHELRVAQPCPMGAEDFFSGCVIPMTYMTGQVESVDYLRRLRDELRDRVAKRIGVLKDERYRLLWVGLPPWYNLGFFNAIGDLGAVFPVETMYFTGPPVDADLSDPVEAIVERTWKRAEWANSCSTEHIPEHFVPCNQTPAGSGLIRSWVKKFKLDGAIMHRTRTCRAMSWGQVHIKNLLAEEGIPSLIIESDMGDPRNWNQSTMMAQVRGLLSTIDSVRKTGAKA